MPSPLSRFIPADSQELKKEFESAYASEIDALYQRFLSDKALQTLKERVPDVLSSPIDILPLEVRTINALKRHFVTNIVDILFFDEASLAKIKGVSPEAASATIAAVNKLLE